LKKKKCRGGGGDGDEQRALELLNDKAVASALFG